jgi:outer membrane protein assembly factor BamB
MYLKKIKCKKIFVISLIFFLLNSIIIVQGFNINTNVNRNINQAPSDNVDWWPMFQHDHINSGFSNSSGPKTNNVLWVFNASRKIHSPSIIDNKIYFGTDHTEGQILSNSFVYCLDLNGNIIWKFKSNGNYDSTPSIKNGYVYISNDNGFINCLNAYNGSPIWNKIISNYPLSSPILFNDKIIINSLDGNVYCLEADSGKFFWKTPISIDILSTSVVVDNKVFVGNYCLDLNNGDRIWTSDIGIPFLSSPSYHQNKIFIGSQDEKFYCVDANTGDKIWKFYIGSMSWETSPAVAYGNVYVGNKFGFIYCLNVEDGEYVWSAKMSARSVSSPAICDGKVYIGSVDNNVYCLDAYTGEKIWNFSSDNPFRCSLAIADGKIFTPSGSSLFCFGAEQNRIADLKCEGFLEFEHVKPSSVIRTNITVENVGENGSELNWSIESFPEWGNWTFQPILGNGLYPRDGKVIVEIMIEAPSVKDCSFSGEVKVINKENADDFETIKTVLSTSKSKYNIELERIMILNFLFNFYIKNSNNILYDLLDSFSKINNFF